VCPGCRDLTHRKEYQEGFGEVLKLHPPKTDEGGFCATCGYKIGIAKALALGKPQAKPKWKEGAPCPSQQDTVWLAQWDADDQQRAPHDLLFSPENPGAYCRKCTYGRTNFEKTFGKIPEPSRHPSTQEQETEDIRVAAETLAGIKGRERAASKKGRT
jgi:hypothetical protein